LQAQAGRAENDLKGTAFRRSAKPNQPNAGFSRCGAAFVFLRG
jgi:hypothetical protein